MARERFGQGANRPESYWLIRPGERIGPGAKRLGTVKTVLGGLPDFLPDLELEPDVEKWPDI